MRRKCFHVVLMALAGMAFAFEPAEAVVVDCNLGQSISAALALGETNITVNGTCTESVYVASDDVTIAGGVNGEIDGSLTIFGAQRFTMQNMAVTATDSWVEGIWVTHAASANFRNITVSGEVEYCAILVYFDSFAEIWDSTLDGNMCGLSVGTGSFVSGRDNEIRNSQTIAVEVYQHGTYRARRDTFDGSAGSGPAVTVSRNSFLDLRSANVTGDVSATDQSHLLIRSGATVTGNIGVDILSELDLGQDSTVVGNIRATNLSIVKKAVGSTVSGSTSCVRSSMCLPRPPQ